MKYRVCARFVHVPRYRPQLMRRAVVFVLERAHWHSAALHHTPFRDVVGGGWRVRARDTDFQG